MEQNTAEWLSWRQSGIGASDMPILFGESDKTPFMLWQEKMGMVSNSITVYARGKGGETEARLRAKYSLETGRQYGPVLASHDEYKWMLASLDMYTVEERKQYMGEVKFVGKKVYESIVSVQTIPRKHYIQMQQQRLVLGSCHCVYLVSDDGDRYKEFEVKDDESLQFDIIKKGTEFFHFMETKTAPPLVENDWWPGSQELIEAVASGDRSLVKELMPNKRVEIPGARITVTANGILRITKK